VVNRDALLGERRRPPLRANNLGAPSLETARLTARERGVQVASGSDLVSETLGLGTTRILANRSAVIATGREVLTEFR